MELRNGLSGGNVYIQKLSVCRKELLFAALPKLMRLTICANQKHVSTERVHNEAGSIYIDDWRVQDTIMAKQYLVLPGGEVVFSHVIRYDDHEPTAQGLKGQGCLALCQLTSPKSQASDEHHPRQERDLRILHWSSIRKSSMKH